MSDSEHKIQMFPSSRTSRWQSVLPILDQYCHILLKERAEQRSVSSYDLAWFQDDFVATCLQPEMICVTSSPRFLRPAFTAYSKRTLQDSTVLVTNSHSSYGFPSSNLEIATPILDTVHRTPYTHVQHSSWVNNSLEPGRDLASCDSVWETRHPLSIAHL